MRGVLFYLKKSKRNIIHHSGCRYFADHTAGNWGSFDTLEDALAAGYRQCKCCSPVGRQYQKERHQILRLCASEGLSCYQADGRIFVTTPTSNWIILACGKKNHLFLYHKNTQFHPKETQDCLIPGYHSQAIRKKTICGYLEFIVSHDKFRYTNPLDLPKMPKCVPPAAQKGTKRWRKEQRNNSLRKRRWEIRNVLDLIDGLHSPLA